MLLQERRIVYSFYLPFCVIVFSLTLLLPCICKLNADTKILKIILALLWSRHNLKYCFLIGVLTDFHKLSKSHEMTLFQSDVLRMCSIFFWIWITSEKRKLPTHWFGNKTSYNSAWSLWKGLFAQYLY